MKSIRIILILLISILNYTTSFAQDNNKYSSVTEYLESLAYNPTDTIITRVVELIESVDDIDTKSRVAGIAYDYFSTSPIMGQETVAVYIADNYFLNKKLKWSDEETYPLLFAFAEFNRQSLIGMSAPELTLIDNEGDNIDIRDINGQYKILYFYDVHCSSCAKQTPNLIDLLNRYDGEPLILYAVYTQSDKGEWMEYVSKNFDNISNDKVTVINLWDPEVDSDFQRKFSVLSTPSMLLLDRNNYIIGRRLESDALSELLNIQNIYIDEYQALFNDIFSSLNPVDSTTAIEIGRVFEQRVGADSSLFRDTFLEMFKYLKDSNSEAAAAIAQYYIVGKPEFWSAELLNEIKESLHLFSLNKIGTKATDLVLRNKRGKDVNIGAIHSDFTILYFHLITCKDCQSEDKILKDNNETLKENGIKVVDIYVGDDRNLWKNSIRRRLKNWIFLNDIDHLSDMHSKYDISIVPKIYLLDKDKNVIAKNISATELIKLFTE